MTSRASPSRPGRLAAVAILCNAFVLIAVNISIYWARAVYIARNPEEAAQQPPTISGAIADPDIGAPFALWVTSSAVALFVGVSALMLLLLGALPRQAVTVRRLVIAVFPFQFLTSAGMVTLSQFTFSNGHFLHMFGSYVAFIAEAVVVGLYLAISLQVARDPALSGALRSARMLHPGANRLRAVLAGLCLATAVVFAFLFYGKDFTEGTLRGWVFLIYVSAEPAFITLSLLTLFTYTADLAPHLHRLLVPARVA